MKAFFKNAILTIVSVFIGLIAMEVVVRLVIVPPAPGAVNAGEAALQKVIMFDPKLESSYKPDATTTIRSQYGEFEVQYHFNELGLRDRPISSTDPKSPFRILALGNSLVEGWGVPEDKAFLRIVEQELGTRLGKAAPNGVRIINAGISGYGAAQSFLFSRDLMEKVRPEALVFFYVSTMVHFDKKFLSRADVNADGLAVGLSVDALLQSNVKDQSDVSGSVLDSKVARRAAQYSALINLIVSRLVVHREQQRVIPGDPQVDLLAGVRANPDKLPELHEPSLRHVAAIARGAKALRLPFLLVHLPLPHQLSSVEWSKGRLAYGLDARIYPAPDRGVIDNFCRKENLHCISAFEVLQQAAAQNPLQRRLFYDFDFHLNQYGNEVLGRWLGVQLQELPGRR